MGHCPFCGTKIPENTLLYGGSCPKCFGEIPGEEAATDPGAEVRARQARSDNRRAAFKTIVPLLLVVPMLGVLMIVALGFVLWNRDPVLEPLDFDAMDGGIEYEIVALPDPAEEDPKVDPDAGKVVRQPTPSAGPRTPAPAAPRPKAGGIADPPKPQVVDTKKGLGGLSGLGSALDNNTNVQREGAEICEPEQIAQMVRKIMVKNQGTLGRCYTEAHERNPQLSGRWRAHFVIQKTGWPSEVSFTGRIMQDSAMEQCFAATVAKWKFDKICSTQEVNKTWKFSPPGQ